MVKRIIKEDQESLTTYENEPIKSKWLDKMLNSLKKTYKNNIPKYELENYDYFDMEEGELMNYIEPFHPDINIEDED